MIYTGGVVFVLLLTTVATDQRFYTAEQVTQLKPKLRRRFRRRPRKHNSIKVNWYCWSAEINDMAMSWTRRYNGGDKHFK
jgi:hypothetical protein